MTAAVPNGDPTPDAALGLPPVLPPSGRFIAQLFVIPGLIILVLVVLYIASTMLVAHERAPAQFLAQLDSDNLDIRWRGANDLAQILKRAEPGTLRWKADARFALDIAERVDRAFQELLKEEQRVGALVAESTKKDKHLLWRQFVRKDRDYLDFLASTLGEFSAPVGAPILCAMVMHEKSADLKGNTIQRRKALWSLVNMGENLKSAAKIPDDKRQAMIAALKDEAAVAIDTPRAGWARTALWYLDKTALPTGPFKGIVKVDETLVATADAEDRYLREIVGVAFTYWDGPQAELTLLKLAQDPGRGTLIRVEDDD